MKKPNRIRAVGLFLWGLSTQKGSRRMTRFKRIRSPTPSALETTANACAERVEGQGYGVKSSQDVTHPIGGRYTISMIVDGNGPVTTHTVQRSIRESRWSDESS
jgi:hypothetical protein